MLKDKVRSRAILLSLIALLSFLGCEKMEKKSPTAVETTLENQPVRKVHCLLLSQARQTPLRPFRGQTARLLLAATGTVTTRFT